MSCRNCAKIGAVGGEIEEDEEKCSQSGVRPEQGLPLKRRKKTVVVRALQRERGERETRETNCWVRFRKIGKSH